jgi:hypothetical protein
MHRAPSFLAPDLPALVVGAELRLLLDHEAEILSTPRFFHAHAGAAGSGLHPDQRLGIGHLLHLWKRERWIRKCTSCGARAYVCFAGFLQSEPRWFAGCVSCDHLTVGVDEGSPPPPDAYFCSFGLDLLGSAMFDDALAILRKHPNAAKVIRGCQPRFSWSKGLVGFSSPDLVVEPRVEALPLPALLDLLRGGAATVAIRDVRGPVDAQRFAFDWASETLRDLDGRPLFTRKGTRIVDATGGVAFYWDGRYFCGSRREYLYEARRLERFTPTRGGEPLPCFVALGDPIAIDRPDGRTVAKFHGRVLALPSGEAVLEADYAAPLPIMWLAQQSMVDPPEIES